MRRRAFLAGGSALALTGMSPVERVAVLGRNNGPSLDLNFLAGAFDSRIAFSRASAAWDFDASGNLAQFAPNVPRVGPNGFLVEEQRTNSIRNPRCEGAVAGTPGTLPSYWANNSQGNGLSQQVVGSGTEDGIPYVDVRYFGTPTVGGMSIAIEQAGAVAALNGQTWTASAYMRGIAGDFALVQAGLGWQELNSTPGFLASHSGGAVLLANTALSSQRRVFTFTNNQSTCAYLYPYYAAYFTSGVAIDFTLRIGLPQLELGAFATSPILPPAGNPAASTRAEDAATMPLGAWFNPAAGTLAAEFQLETVTANRNSSILCLDDGATTRANCIDFFAGVGPVGVANVRANGSIQGSINAGSVYSAGATMKTAVTYTATALTQAVNGAAPITSPVTQLPTGLAYLRLGSERWAGVQTIDGYLRRVRYWPRALSPSELQAITT